MSEMAVFNNLRILVLDDNRAIHDDFRKILGSAEPSGTGLEDAEALLFDTPAGNRRRLPFEIDSAYQGQEGLALVEQSLAEGRPYAVAFVDVRMPPGWDGVETAARMWEVCPDLQIVICTAYSDYSWDEMADRLNHSDQLLILKKPFDTVEVLQLATALTAKWWLHQQVRRKLESLEMLVQERTRVLQETNERLHREVAERERAAQALRESDDRYQLLFRRNPLPMWVFDLETLAFLAVNETAVRHYGYSVEEFLGMTLKEIRPASELPALMRRLEEARDANPGSFITRHRKKDGRIIDVEAISRTISFAGRPAKLALASDITERKSAEDRIREQATLLDLAHDAIFVRDLAGRVKFWNKGAERLYGWTAEEAVGRTINEIFTPRDPAAFEQVERELLEKGDWKGELHKHTRKGEEVISSTRGTLLHDEAGKPRSVLMIDTDITDKKKLETQFLRAQRMEGIGTLATGMAHDLNNILAPILMSAGTLRWKLTSTEQEMAISRIEMSVKRGAEIIQQVLTFGRGVSGDRVPVNPGELIEEVCRFIDQTFPKDITITRDINPGLWPIIGDRTQIHQVLLNLCINARDAMTNGGRLTLHASNIMVAEHYGVRHDRTQPGPYVLLQVADTGCGIAPSDIERIFDPFFTTKEFGKGTGLGLSTVSGIVRSHKGLVAVDSSPGNGATFKVLLPASPATARLHSAGSVAAAPRGEGETILIVDDEENIVGATRETLLKNGYQVLVAKDGEAALATFQSQSRPIDLVITDIMMPGPDGIALIQNLRRIRPELKIIASSGLGRDLGGGSRAADLESLGLRTFLAKPYSAEILLTALRKELGSPPPAKATQGIPRPGQVTFSS